MIVGIEDPKDEPDSTMISFSASAFNKGRMRATTLTLMLDVVGLVLLTLRPAIIYVTIVSCV